MQKLIISVLFTLVSLTWGTTWLAMKIAVETIPPIFATGMRFIFAAPLLIFIAWYTKTPLLLPVGQRAFQLAISIFYFSIPFTLMIYGETYISSGLAAIIFANMPVAILITSILFLHEKTNTLQITGLTIAIIALASILLAETETHACNHWQGMVALISAVIIHSVMYAQCKKRCYNVPVITFNALPCFIAGLILSSVGWFVEKPQLDTFSEYSIYATIYLGVFAGVFGILCYFSLQQKVNAFQASIVFLIFPLIAVSLENYLYGCDLSFGSMILLLPLICGILITLLSQKNRTTKKQIKTH
ncbi:DMT family transporter [Yersinia aleksiciae]|uniref:DMT family transporter n=1 Tax=Yersinia aleksiciae TaxID=263819 RepID=UPI001427E5F4|nr:DMT family transporter [Yersinia aleksiciae]MDA5497425.1 DMT family transporter [Yersinia aleksiciae]NIK98358.1 DMT family transporter [Yersinia aleksiciae]WQC72691.1 DMT family transporter [Yersinia aleksiciae]